MDLQTANSEKISLSGLSAEEVSLRIKNKQTNRIKKVVGKSYLQIFMGNIFTFFNLLGFIIFVLMAFFGNPSEMLFIVVILSNTVIGIFQEIRSKLAVEKLSLVSEPTVEVIRDGNKTTISTNDVVLDDIVCFSAGNQVCADCKIVYGIVEVNESMLTGESVAVKKTCGDTLYRGSFIISGSATAQAEMVGKDTYIEKLSTKVKKAKMPNSQLIKGIMTIIKFIAIIIFPLGIATFCLSNQIADLMKNYSLNIWQIWYYYFNPSLSSVDVVGSVRSAVQQACGSMLGMVPSGMVLLTSIALAVGALKLARKKVLVRELPCIEMLARVDTLCLDKTGTITDGSMTVEQLIPFANYTKEQLKSFIASVLNATADKNMTAEALSKFTSGAKILPTTNSLAFSSARKYSAATVSGVGTIVFGAAEFMFQNVDESFSKTCNDLLGQGLRVLAVGISSNEIVGEKVENLQPIAVIALQDTIRSDATQIIDWFMQNQVAVKVISGDNPLSVSVIAQKVGIKNAQKYISLEGLTDEQVEAVANEYTVFGRVTPDQKAVLIRSMKNQGHTVAMTGDGVNDILAMKESDCAISVGCGSDAAKTVANLVLTDNKFSSMPNVVAEGRQVVNNVQNSTSLFLMKTAMVVFITILTLIMSVVSLTKGGSGVSFPFSPNKLSAVNLFVIGVPSFLLALKPNKNLIKGSFLKNTVKGMLPSGLGMFLSVAAVYLFQNVLSLTTDEQITTTAMFAMSFTGVAALWILCFPFDLYNIAVASLGTIGVALELAFFEPLYNWAIVLLTNDETKKIVYIVDIPSKAVWFIVLDILAMTAIIIGAKLLIKFLEKRSASKVKATI